LACGVTAGNLPTNASQKDAVLVARLRALDILKNTNDSENILALNSVSTYLQETTLTYSQVKNLLPTSGSGLIAKQAKFVSRCKIVDNIDFHIAFNADDAFGVETNRVLSLGEGNFSFSSSVSDGLSSTSNSNFVATEYRTYQELYDQSLIPRSNINMTQVDAALANLSSNGAQPLLGIDGTNLPTNIGNFDVVIFNFPFVDEVPKIRNTKDMLAGVMAQMETRLNPGGKIIITHKASWAGANRLDIASLHNGTSLNLLGDKEFLIQQFPGYSHVVSNPSGGSANVTKGVTFIFKKK